MICKFCGSEKKFCMGDNNLYICSDCAKLCRYLITDKIDENEKIIEFPTGNLGA